jgi:hypothetical protein
MLAAVADRKKLKDTDDPGDTRAAINAIIGTEWCNWIL